MEKFVKFLKLSKMPLKLKKTITSCEIMKLKLETKINILNTKVEVKRIRKKFIWRLIGLFIILFFLVGDLVYLINYPNFFYDFTVSKPTERLAIYYSFFTTQTNYLVLIYLFSFLFESKFHKDNQHKFYISLSITVYITVTMLVFWLGFFTGDSQERLKYTVLYSLLKTIIMHSIVPIIMILNFIITCGKEKQSLKNHHKLYLWFILFYPFFYFGFVLLRGTLRYHQGEQIATCYPYPFLNYEKNGVGLLIGTIIVIFFIFIVLQYLYIWINNFRFKKRQK